jgi:hypothetical protein
MFEGSWSCLVYHKNQMSHIESLSSINEASLSYCHIIYYFVNGLVYLKYWCTDWASLLKIMSFL